MEQKYGSDVDLLSRNVWWMLPENRTEQCYPTGGEPIQSASRQKIHKDPWNMSWGRI